MESLCQGLTTLTSLQSLDVSGNKISNVAVLDKVYTNIVAYSHVTGHSGGVTSVSWSPDGKRLASGSWDKTVRIWEVATGKELSQLNVGGSVSSIDFAPCGNKLAAAFNIYQYGSFKEGGVKIFSNQGSAGFVCQSTLSGEKQINSVAFSPDGSLIAAGDGGFGDEGTIRLYNAATGDPFGSPLRGHMNRVSSVCFSPDGAKIVSGSWDKTVLIWDAASGEQLCSLKAHSDWVRAVAWSPCGQWLASGGDDKMVYVYDAKTFEVKWPLRGHRYAPSLSKECFLSFG